MALQALVAHHLGRGFQYYGINWALKPPFQPARPGEESAAFGLPIEVYRLSYKRCICRRGPDLAHELWRARKLMHPRCGGYISDPRHKPVTYDKQTRRWATSLENRASIAPPTWLTRALA